MIKLGWLIVRLELRQGPPYIATLHVNGLLRGAQHNGMNWSNEWWEDVLKSNNSSYLYLPCVTISLHWLIQSDDFIDWENVCLQHPALHVKLSLIILFQHCSISLLLTKTTSTNKNKYAYSGLPAHSLLLWSWTPGASISSVFWGALPQRQTRSVKRNYIIVEMREMKIHQNHIEEKSYTSFFCALWLSSPLFAQALDCLASSC